MAASPFERQVVEDDATNDRSPSTPKMADGPQQFPPTPSFLANDRPTVRMVELPAWLQSFASSVGEPSEESTPVEQDESPSEQPVSVSNQDAQRKVTPQTRPSRPKTSNVGTDFISEDDLPEWLRSIAPDESSDHSMETLILDRGDDGEQITVPNITRAWSTSKDQRGVDETTSLFALVASQSQHAALPDPNAVAPKRAAATGGGAKSSDQVITYGSDRPPNDSASIQVPEVRLPEDSGTESGSSLPILPIVVGALLLLILIGAAVVMFIL